MYPLFILHVKKLQVKYLSKAAQVVTGYKHTQIKFPMALNSYSFHWDRWTSRRNRWFYHSTIANTSFEMGKNRKFPQILTSFYTNSLLIFFIKTKFVNNFIYKLSNVRVFKYNLCQYFNKIFLEENNKELQIHLRTTL